MRCVVRVVCSAGATIGLSTEHHGYRCAIPVQQFRVRGRPRDGTHCRPDNRWIRAISPSHCPPPICTPSQLGQPALQGPGTVRRPRLVTFVSPLRRSRLAQLWSARLPKAIAPREITLLALSRSRTVGSCPQPRLLIASAAAPARSAGARVIHLTTAWASSRPGERAPALKTTERPVDYPVRVTPGTARHSTGTSEHSG